MGECVEIIYRIISFSKQNIFLQTNGKAVCQHHIFPIHTYLLAPFWGNFLSQFSGMFLVPLPACARGILPWRRGDRQLSRVAGREALFWAMAASEGGCVCSFVHVCRCVLFGIEIFLVLNFLRDDRKKMFGEHLFSPHMPHACVRRSQTLCVHLVHSRMYLHTTDREFSVAPFLRFTRSTCCTSFCSARELSYCRGKLVRWKCWPVDR